MNAFTCLTRLVPIIILQLLLGSSQLHAADFTIHFTDENTLPLTNAVAALIPEQTINYNEQPTAIMDQRHNMFVPGVLAIRVNTLVRFPNSDDVRHHVYSFSPAKKFELRLYHGKTAKPVLFDQAGKVVLGCNIHDSMVAYIYVVNTEYFAVSDASGITKLTNIPPGNYTLEIYHPDLSRDYPTKKISIHSDDSVIRNIQLTDLAKDDYKQSDDEFSELFQ